MARGLKTLGLEEVQSALKRTRRQKALGRIGHLDARYIEERLMQVEARILEMREEGEEAED